MDNSKSEAVSEDILQERYKCEQCKVSYENIYLLERHVNYYHKSHLCKKCLYVFSNIKMYFAHHFSCQMYLCKICRTIIITSWKDMENHYKEEHYINIMPMMKNEMLKIKLNYELNRCYEKFFDKYLVDDCDIDGKMSFDYVERLMLETDL